MRQRVVGLFCKGFSERSFGKVLRRHYATPAAQFECAFPCPPIPETNITDYFMADFEQRGELPALVCGASGKEITFAGMKSLSRQFGSGLLNLGLEAGDKVAVLAPNCPEYGPVLFGSLGVAVTVVPISPLFTAGEVARVLKLAEPKLIVTVDPLVPLVTAAQKELGNRLPMVTMSDNPTSSAVPFSQFTDNDGSDYDLKRSVIAPRSSVAILPFSSGTTGPPKGVMLTHYNLTAMMVQYSDMPTGCALDKLQPGQDQKTGISIIPMYHVYGLVVNTMHAMLAGAKSIILPKFEPDSFVSSLAKHQPHFFNLVPPLVAFLALNPAITREEHLCRAIAISCGGSPLSSQIVAAVRAKAGPCELKEGYGMTETSSGVTRTHRNMDESLRGTVGKLLVGTEARVEDPDTRQLVEPGHPGELVVRGPQVMLGYYKNPVATAEVLQDGWLRTGDVVTHDREGNITIVDRIKDMIKVKGLQVSPTELEEVLVKVPGVLEGSVIGVPDERLGEAPKAFVVKKPGHQVTEEAVHEFFSERLAKYKQLAGGVVFVEELPKNATGKVLRKELRG